MWNNPIWNKIVRVAAAGCACVLLLSASAWGVETNGTLPVVSTRLPVMPLTLRDDSVEHTRFITGDNGTFRPNAPVNRAEASQMLYRLVEEVPETHLEFDDVSPKVWYHDCVTLMAEAGMLDWEDAEVHPKRAMTRAEFVSMVVRFFPAPETVLESACFTDVPEDHPYREDVFLAASYGWVEGYTSFRFGPDDTLTRAQAVTIINRALGRVPDQEMVKQLVLSPYKDVSTKHWAYAQILEATLNHTCDPEEETERWAEVDTAPLRRPGGLYFSGVDYYYIDPDTGLPLVDASLGDLYFGADGKYTSGDAEIDGYTKDALSGVITSGMTQEEKLRAAYNYARDSFTYLRRNYYEIGDVIPALEEARTMFTTKRGNCYCYAAVFWCLARQLGYDAQLISGKVNNINPVPHGWVEIELDGQPFMYDCELEMSYRKKGVYYYNFYHMAYDEVPWRYYR